MWWVFPYHWPSKCLETRIIHLGIIALTEKWKASFKLQDSTMSKTRIQQGDLAAAVIPTLQRTARREEKDPGAAIEHIGSLCGSLRLVDTIRRKARRLYKKVSQAGIVRGRPIASVVPAVVLIACWQMGVPSESYDTSSAGHKGCC